MAAKLPYIVQPPILPKVFAKIQQAPIPDRFTQEFLADKLGFKGGNHRQFIPLAKKLGLLAADGTPTDRYRQLKTTSRVAVADGVRDAYRELFDRNENAATLLKDELKALVIEIAGLDAKDRVVQLICQTFEELKKAADFDAKPAYTPVAAAAQPALGFAEVGGTRSSGQDRDFGISPYTVNLVLPTSHDPAVFNAVFKALKDNLLKK